MKLLSFQPALPGTAPLRLDGLLAGVEAPAIAPFGAAATLLAGALICCCASAAYLLLVHPASARFEEQWQLGFLLASLAWLQAAAAGIVAWRSAASATTLAPSSAA